MNSTPDTPPTPTPDPVNMLIMMVPLVLLYELGIVLARTVSRSREREAGNWFASFADGLAASAAGERAVARAAYERARVLDPREPLVAEGLARIDGPHPLTAAEAFGRVRRNVQRLSGQS